MQSINDFDFAIIGAGITGLSAAHFLNSRNKQRTIVLDQAPRAGGKIRTVYEDFGAESPLLLEVGADSMLSTKPQGIQLATNLGLSSQIVETRKERQVFVLRRDQLIAMPEGLMLVVPKHLWPFIRSPLFSFRGKMRMALDFFLPRKIMDEDESMGSFIRRRLGQEALDLLAEPILSGIYGANPERQSLKATFPQLLELEKKYGGLIKGAMRSQTGASTGKREKSLFVSFKGGMQSFIDALHAHIDSDIRLNTGVTDLQRAGLDSWKVALSSGEVIKAKKVLITTPARSTAHILRTCAPRSADIYAQIRHTSTGCVYLAYEKSQVSHSLAGYGFLVPRSEGKMINAVTWVSSKIEDRCPLSHVLFRVFFGGERHPKLLEHEDIDLISMAAREVEKIHGISGTPIVSKVYRSVSGSPQYDVGHLQRIEKAKALLPHGVSVIGCSIQGVGIPDCIKQAEDYANANA